MDPALPPAIAIVPALLEVDDLVAIEISPPGAASS
jgi:hypothetical protein